MEAVDDTPRVLLVYVRSCVNACYNFVLSIINEICTAIFSAKNFKTSNDRTTLARSARRRKSSRVQESRLFQRVQQSPRAFVLLGALLQHICWFEANVGPEAVFGTDEQTTEFGHQWSDAAHAHDHSSFSSSVSRTLSNTSCDLHPLINWRPNWWRKPDAVRVFSAQLLNVPFVPQHVVCLRNPPITIYSDKASALALLHANRDPHLKSLHGAHAAGREEVPGWLWPWTAGRSADSLPTSLPLHLPARLDVPDQSHLQIQGWTLLSVPTCGTR